MLVLRACIPLFKKDLNKYVLGTYYTQKLKQNPSSHLPKLAGDHQPVRLVTHGRHESAERSTGAGQRGSSPRAVKATEANGDFLQRMASEDWKL